MKVEFIASSRNVELVVPPPLPAKNFIPEWYKKTTSFIDSNKPLYVDGAVSNKSIKTCAPFHDAMTHGYIQKTWCDIHFEFIYKDGNLISYQYNFAHGPSIISHRNHQNIPVLSDFHPVEMVWLMPWTPILPNGWSMLFVNPLNNFSSPLYSTSGIIDSDVFFHTPKGNYPFYVNKKYNDFTIPEGTPMYQMIPIKRENWESKVKNISDEDRYVLQHKNKKYFINPYKRFFHKKKTFK